VSLNTDERRRKLPGPRGPTQYCPSIPDTSVSSKHPVVCHKCSRAVTGRFAPQRHTVDITHGPLPPDLNLSAGMTVVNPTSANPTVICSTPPPPCTVVDCPQARPVVFSPLKAYRPMAMAAFTPCIWAPYWPFALAPLFLLQICPERKQDMESKKPWP